MSACRIIAVTGAPGAGKTEVGRALIRRCPPGSALLDSDAVAGVHPFVVDERFNWLAAANLSACIENFLAWGARTVVLTGVLVPDGILPHMSTLLADQRLSWRFYGLRASKEVLVTRLAIDPKPQDADQRAQWTHLDAVLDRIPGCRIITTDSLPLESVVDLIAEGEGLRQKVLT